MTGGHRPGLVAGLVRAAWGVGVLAFPDHGLRLLGHPRSPGARLVLRILGLRDAVQAAVELARPTVPVLATGVVVDLLHAGTGIAYATSARDRRRPGATSAGLSVLAAAAGLVARRQVATAPTPTSHVPGDQLPHDGLQGAVQQLVLLEGGPMAGARVPVAWSARVFSYRDEQLQTRHYVDSGRTSRSADGLVRIFVKPRNDP